MEVEKVHLGQSVYRRETAHNFTFPDFVSMLRYVYTKLFPVELTGVYDTT